MSIGEPKPMAGRCNAGLRIGDNYGDNHATMLCQLEPGHEGDHQESHPGGCCGRVTVRWESRDPEIEVEHLQDEIEQAILSVHSSAHQDYEWIEDLGASVFKYTVGPRAVWFRVNDLNDIRVMTSNVGQEQPLPKEAAIEALIGALQA